MSDIEKLRRLGQISALLREAAKTVLGNKVRDVLITDIMRRDG